MPGGDFVVRILPSGRRSGAALAFAAALGVTPAQAEQDGREESILVQGFKSSLERALDAKRNADIVSDSIEAEDIAKFSDLNLSEAIQRIPGVAISRDAGE